MSVLPGITMENYVILHLPFLDWKSVIQPAMSLDAFYGVKSPECYRFKVGVPVFSFTLKRSNYIFLTSVFWGKVCPHMEIHFPGTFPGTEMLAVKCDIEKTFLLCNSTRLLFMNVCIGITRLMHALCKMSCSDEWPEPAQRWGHHCPS